MNKKLKEQIKDIVEDVLKEEKLTGSGGEFFLWSRVLDRESYVEGVVSKLDRMETLVEKLRELTKSDDYEYVEEKKLKKKVPVAKTATEVMAERDLDER